MFNSWPTVFMKLAGQLTVSLLHYQTFNMQWQCKDAHMNLFLRAFSYGSKQAEKELQSENDGLA